MWSITHWRRSVTTIKRKSQTMKSKEIVALVPSVVAVLGDRPRPSDSRLIDAASAVEDVNIGTEAPKMSAPQKRSARRSRKTDAIVRKTLAGIVGEALGNAQLLGEHISGYAEQFYLLGCTTESDMHDFFNAAELVLAELYHEAGKPHASPMRLTRLGLQYALDPRRPIEGDIQRFHLRWTDSGLEVVEYPSVAQKAVSIPHPGRSIRNIHAKRILALLSSGSPQFFRLRKLIEEILGESPPEPPAPSSRPKRRPKLELCVDVEKSTITIAGVSYSVSYSQVHFVKVLFDARGAFVVGRHITAQAMLVGTRPDRICKDLPAAILKLIEKKRGRGYRLRMEQLE